MKTTADPKSRLKVAATQKEFMRSGAVAIEVLTSTARNIQLIQSNAGAEMFTRCLESLAPAFSPAGGAYCFQHLPEFYATQSTALVKAATETFGELLRAQQTLTEMGSQSSSWPGVKESAEATTQALRKFYNRRVTAEVISFPNRRAA